jgi:hypothetical protein
MLNVRYAKCKLRVQKWADFLYYQQKYVEEMFSKQCCGSGSRIRDLLDPWIQDPGWVKNQDPEPGSGSGMHIQDHISKSIETILWVKNTKIL